MQIPTRGVLSHTGCSLRPTAIATTVNAVIRLSVIEQGNDAKHHMS